MSLSSMPSRTNAVAACGTKLLIHGLGRVGLDCRGGGGPTPKRVLEGTQVGVLELCNCISL